MKRSNFYRRDPSKALSGMVGLTLEERGVYNTILDLLYLTWRPLEDNRAYIAAHCGCAVQKLSPIIRSLINKQRLVVLTERGRTFLSDEHFERERASVKGASVTPDRGEVAEKSGEVGEKSGEVGKNPPSCRENISQFQSVAPLDKIREEKTREDYEGLNGRESDPIDDWPDGRPAEVLVEIVNSSILDPNRSHGLISGQGEVVRWKQAGCSWTLDVIPVVKAGVASALAKSNPIRSWNFFTDAVLRQRDRRLTPLPEPKQVPHEPTGHPNGARSTSDRRMSGAESLIAGAALALGRLHSDNGDSTWDSDEGRPSGAAVIPFRSLPPVSSVQAGSDPLSHHQTDAALSADAQFTGGQRDPAGRLG